jgi:adenosylcobinamide kinase/adenosylcobinamide-phosphate guanylyltransferase
MGELILVTGGSRSGKSRWAQAQVERAPGPHIFIATCPRFADDAEMAARIARHQQDRRDRGWQTVEEQLALAGAIAAQPSAAALLVDCLALWCNNLLHAAGQAGEDFGEDAAAAAAQDVAAACRQRSGLTVLVSNEVGLGVIPANPLARRFVDCLGRLNQQLAAAADSVVLCSCGLPLALKGRLA